MFLTSDNERKQQRQEKEVVVTSLLDFQMTCHLIVILFITVLIHDVITAFLLLFHLNNLNNN